MFRKLTIYIGSNPVPYVIPNVFVVEHVGKEKNILHLVDNKTKDYYFTGWCHIIDEPQEHII